VAIIKRCILLMQFLKVLDTNSLTVNIKFIQIKVTVRKNLKRPNHNYPCHLVSRHLFPVTTTRYIPWVQFVFPTLRFGRLYYTSIRHRHLRISSQSSNITRTTYSLQDCDEKNALNGNRSTSESGRRLRSQFFNIIQMVHPNQELPYSI
jgi:hypothetical protein